MTEPATEAATPAPPRQSLVALLRGSAKWWLIPALVVIVLVVVLVLFTETAAAPFVYSTF
jgi:hypothetical protein